MKNRVGEELPKDRNTGKPILTADRAPLTLYDPEEAKKVRIVKRKCCGIKYSIPEGQSTHCPTCKKAVK